MADQTDKPTTEYALFQLLPNMVTIVAICAGLSAIRFCVLGEYTLAVQFILAASVLDALDGRLARLLGSDSLMGAELDSLADFLNFGVATPLTIYFWALQGMHSAAWLPVLIFCVCCVVRLARFNVASKSDADHSNGCFVGVPAPAGALLVMLPMYVSFAFDDMPQLPGLIICIYMVLIGLLMISHIPTWSFKTIKVSRENAKYLLVGFAVVVAAVLSFAWTTLIALCLGYAGTIVWTWLKNRKTPKEALKAEIGH